MNIGIIYKANEKKRTGVSNSYYATMKQILKIDSMNKYYAVCGDYYNIGLIEKKMINNSNDNSQYYNAYCYMNKIDILHSFWDAFYDIKNVKYKILTQYDLIPLVHKEWHSSLYSYFDGPLRKASVEADKIIAISEHTKKDLVDYYNINPDKIEVIYLGNNQICKTSYPFEKCQLKYGITREYILGVSSLVKYKNFQGVIEAYCEFREMNKECDVQLVIVGKSAWMGEGKIEQEIANKYKKDIIFTGYVSDEELSCLYQNAFLFMYISFYEGFGLPILEAMSYGKAVISSNTTSMPEIGGDAVEYCNPYEIDSVLAAMEKVINNKDHRELLESRATIQASKFTYEKTAEEIINLYNNI